MANGDLEMDTLALLQKLEHWIQCNEFTQQPEAANYGIGRDYQAIDAEDLKEWIQKQYLLITGDNND